MIFVVPIIPANYEKLKQASSLFADKNPECMKMVHRVYGKMMKLEDELDGKRQERMQALDDEEAADIDAQIARLEAVQAGRTHGSNGAP